VDTLRNQTTRTFKQLHHSGRLRTHKNHKTVTLMKSLHYSITNGRNFIPHQVRQTILLALRTGVVRMCRFLSEAVDLLCQPTREFVGTGVEDFQVALRNRHCVLGINPLCGSSSFSVFIKTHPVVVFGRFLFFLFFLMLASAAHDVVGYKLCFGEFANHQIECCGKLVIKESDKRPVLEQFIVNLME